MFCATCGTHNPDDGTFCAKCGNVLHGRSGIAAATVPPRAAATIPPSANVPIGGMLGGPELFAGRFELREVLGKGGMGVVRRALDRELGEEIAIKLLQPQFTKDAHEVERFKREILTARRITHPNVIRIHDYGTSGHEFFISMELLAGGTLAERIARGGMTLADSVAIAAGIADGLAAAHAKGVIHRDLKPHNVLFDADGTPKLVDFGIARFATATKATRGFAGTPHYISPEQAKGQDATERSDVYSLGVLLFELFTGRLPFDADSLVALAVKHAQEPPPPPRSLRPDLPPALEAIVLRCLEKDPAARFASPTEIASALLAAHPSASTSRTAPSSGAADPHRSATIPPRATPPPITPPPASSAPLVAMPPLSQTPDPRMTPPPQAVPPRHVRGGGSKLLSFAVLFTILGVGMCGILFAFVEVQERIDAITSPTPGASGTPAVAAASATPTRGKAPATKVASAPTPPRPSGIPYTSPYGWSLTVPNGWSTVPQIDGTVLFQDPGGSSGIYAAWVPGGTVEQIRAQGAQPVNVSGAQLFPNGPLVPIAGGRGLASDYAGAALDGTPVAARGAAVPASGGVVVLVGGSTADRQSSVRSSVDTMAASVR